VVKQGADRNEMDGQHHNLDKTGYGGATEIGGEQTGMEECFAERVQPSDRGWIRTEQNLGFKLPSGLLGCRLLVEHILSLTETNAYRVPNRTHVHWSIDFGRQPGRAFSIVEKRTGFHQLLGLPPFFPQKIVFAPPPIFFWVRL